MRKKIALIENSGIDFYNARLRYALHLQNLGYEVYAIVPDDGFSEKIKSHGINVIEVSNNINIFPNPTNDNITVSVINHNGNIQTEVYDLIGHRLQTTNETTISLQDYARGIYLLKVAYGDRVEEVKVIKD